MQRAIAARFHSAVDPRRASHRRGSLYFVLWQTGCCCMTEQKLKAIKVDPYYNFGIEG